jgi:hypothetical protein
MITGYNTDVEYEGRIYHVQTEDKGVGNPHIESLVYVGGEIVGSHRSSYQDLVSGGPDLKTLTARLEAQHQRMVLNVRQGRHAPEGMKPFGAGVITDRGFEEVVLDYLSRELSAEGLQIEVENPLRFAGGTRHDLVVQARGELSALPVKDVRVSLSLITPVEKPAILAEGRTDATGCFRAGVSIPPVEAGSAAVVLQAVLDQERVEMKWMVGAEAERKP